MTEAGRGHATLHMPVETAKCWWLLKLEANVWAGGKGICAVCVDLQAVGTLEFFGELYSLAKGFGPVLRGLGAGFREREGSINFLVTTSTSPAYEELHALSPLHGSISPWATNCWCSSAICREFLEPEWASFHLSCCTKVSLSRASAAFPIGGATIN